jgi:hypothetical protein
VKKDRKIKEGEKKEERKWGRKEKEKKEKDISFF